MNIPIQLQKPEFRFVKIRRGEKAPTPQGKNWETTNNHTYNDPVMVEWLKQNQAGIVCGLDNIRCVDIDQPEAVSEVLARAKETFTVKSGSGKGIHLFYRSPYATNHKLTVGDYKADRSQVVIAGSIHPSGGTYTIIKDLPIADMSEEEMRELLAPYIKTAPNNQDTKDHTTDESRSGKEFSEVLRLVKKGKTDAEIMSAMMAFAKWATAHQQYRELTIKKAREAAMTKKENKKEEEKNESPQLVISAEEQNLAEELLENPLLLEIIHSNLDKRITSERAARQTVLLAAIGALYVKNSKPASNCLVLNSASSSGKDYVTANVLDLFPKNQIIKRTRISPTALTYWKRRDLTWNWDGKVLYLSDVSNEVLNCDVVKVMVTEGSHATITINQEAVDIEVKGKPGIIATIASAQPTAETLTRFPFAQLDESVNQTAAIMEREGEAAALGIAFDTSYDRNLLNAIALLRPVDVVIPYAPTLAKIFPSAYVGMRRHFNRLLQYIRSSASLYQRQRKTNEQGAIIAQSEDYEHARMAIIALTSNPAMVPLSTSDKKILAIAKKQNKPFSVSDINEFLPDLSERSLYERLGILASHGMLIPSTEVRPPSTKPVKIYSYVEQYVHVPTWEEVSLKAIEAFAVIEAIARGGRNRNEHQNTIESTLDTYVGKTAIASGGSNASEGSIASNAIDSVSELVDFMRQPKTGSVFVERLIALGFKEEVIERALQTGELFEDRAGSVRAI